MSFIKTLMTQVVFIFLPERNTPEGPSHEDNQNIYTIYQILNKWNNNYLLMKRKKVNNLYILKRKRNTTVFNPLFLPHGSQKAKSKLYPVSMCIEY